MCKDIYVQKKEMWFSYKTNFSDGKFFALGDFLSEYKIWNWDIQISLGVFSKWKVIIF